MRLPRMQTLVHTALGVAVVGVGAAIYMQQKQLKVFSDSEFFKETLKILRTHRGTYKCNKSIGRFAGLISFMTLHLIRCRRSFGRTN